MIRSIKNMNSKISHNTFHLLSRLFGSRWKRSTVIRPGTQPASSSTSTSLPNEISNTSASKKAKSNLSSCHHSKNPIAHPTIYLSASNGLLSRDFENITNGPSSDENTSSVHSPSVSVEISQISNEPTTQCEAKTTDDPTKDIPTISDVSPKTDKDTGQSTPNVSVVQVQIAHVPPNKCVSMATDTSSSLHDIGLHSISDESALFDPTALYDPCAISDESSSNAPSAKIWIAQTQLPMGEKQTLSEREMAFQKSSIPPGISDFVQNNLAAKIDLRYGGQYFTAEQLPEFCEQLRHLVEMIRNIQSYATLTGEYPSALEKRLNREAREVAALAAEVRNARESVERVREQRRAVRAHRREAVGHLVALREEETRELECTVRVADRKMYKSWENLREAVDVHAFDSLLSEVKGKQNVLECMARLIENRRVALQLLASSAAAIPRTSIPSSGALEQNSRSRYFTNRKPYYRRRKKEREMPSHSMPVSNDSSLHSNAESRSDGRHSGIYAITNCTTINSTNPASGSVNSVIISNRSPASSIEMNPMTVPYELISQSGIPANMLPSMGSNSNHNLNLNVTGVHPFVPFRFGAVVPQSDLRVTTSDGDQAAGGIVFMRIDDQ